MGTPTKAQHQDVHQKCWFSEDSQVCQQLCPEYSDEMGGEAGNELCLASLRQLHAE